MNDARETGQRTRRLAHALLVITALLFGGGALLRIVREPAETVLVLLVALPIAMYGTVGVLVARRRPQNPIGWLFCAVGLSLATWIFGFAYAGFAGVEDVGSALPGAAAAAWVTVLTPVAVLAVALPAFLLVFPDGHLRSRRWGIAIVGAALGSTLVALGIAATIHRYDGDFGLVPPGWVVRIPSVGGLVGGGLALVGAAALAGLVSLAIRFREAEGERRQQLRLLLWMLVVMAAAPLLLPLGWLGAFFVFLVDGGGILFGIPGATAIAVLTYGLYDVGVVVKKTIVYGLVVVFITGFTAIVIFFFSPLAVGTGDSGPAERIISGAAIVALMLAATWRPTRRMARRIVYGKRATPYEAMSEFSDRLGEAYSTEDVVPRMAQILREGTGAERVRVWLRIGEELRPAASAPSEPPGTVEPLALDGAEAPTFEGGERGFPVRHQGELLGVVSVRMPASEPLRGAGEKLVADLTAQAGLVLRNVRLTEELRQKIEELRASRQRIVAAQDERARKLERDIHDGAQQQLVALAVKLRLAEHLTEADPPRARTMLAELQGEANEALENLRDLARGIYPPVLADRGLGDALTAQTRKSPVPGEIHADGLGRFPQEIESAVYFCVLEGLQNVAKYSNASRVVVRLAEANGDLSFAVDDDGVGFDPASARGSGLTNMRDRVEALGGELHLRSSVGGGTTVTGRIPVEGLEDHP